MMNTRLPEAQMQKIPIPWRIYLLIGFITLLIVGAMAYVLQQTKNISATHDLLLVNVSEIELKVTTAHLWLEEILSGDRDEKIETVKGLLDYAEECFHSLDDRKFYYSKHVLFDIAPVTREDHGRFHWSHASHTLFDIKESLQAVGEKLNELRDVFELRYQERQASGPGTEIDKRFDRIFAEFQKETGEIMRKISDSKATHMAEFQAIQTILIFICLVLAALISVILHRFERRRAEDFLAVLRGEDALRDSEERFRVTFEQAAVGISHVSPQGRFLRINQRLCDIWGYTREELLDLSFQEITYPDDLDRDLEKMNQVLAGEIAAYNIEKRYICKDGSVIWGNHTVALVCESSGEPKYFISVVEDISDRKWAEEENQLNEARLEALLKTSQMIQDHPDKIAEFALEESARLTQSEIGFINFLSEDEKSVTHAVYTKETLKQCKLPITLSAFEISDCGLWSEAYRQRKPIIVNDYAVDHSSKTDLPNGHLQLKRFMSIPIFEKDRVVAVAALGNKLREYNQGDVRQFRLFMEGLWQIINRKHAEEALRESEEKYRTVIEANPDPVVVYDMEGKVVYFNPAFTRIFGWLLEDLIGKKLDVFVPKKNWPETRMMIEKALIGENFSGIESQRHTKEGGIIPVRISGSTYRDQEGNPVGSVVNLRDIRKQKKMETQLQQAQKMEAIGTLAGGIAHDFNNILFPIVGYAEMMMEDIPEDSILQDSLNQMLIGTKRAMDLVKQILAFSRQTDGELKPLKIHFVVREVLKLIRSSLPSTIEIQQYIDNKCGLVMADSTQVHQLAMNLITNAYHAMEDEGGKLDVTLKEVELGADNLKDPSMIPGSYVCLTVADTGIGMDKPTLDRIFDPYFTTKEKDKGTGLGLSIVHGIVKSHGGDISVYSEPGKGTTFHAYFPLIDTKVETRRTESIVPVQKGNERILLVDDEEQIALMEKRMLERLGYHVTERTSSVEALEAFRAAPDKFDIVISDMTMPNMTGVHLSQKLMEIRPDIPIIICTGFSKQIDEEKAKAIGIRGYVMKPVVKNELAKKIREALNQS